MANITLSRAAALWGRMGLSARRGIAFVYAAVLAGAAAAVTLSVADTGQTLWTSAPLTATAATRLVDTADATPARLLLVPRRNLIAGTSVDSNTVRLSGITVPVGVAVSAGAEVSVDGSPFGAGPMVAERGQPIVLRAATPPAGGSATVTLTTGTVTSDWMLASSPDPAHSHQTLYGPWGACSAAAPCDGMGTQRRDILCLRSDGRFVAVSDCSATLTASETRSCPSPAGTTACVPMPALAEGAATQYCAAGSTARGVCVGLNCAAPYQEVAGSCVLPAGQSLPRLSITMPDRVDESEGGFDITLTAGFAIPADLSVPMALVPGAGHGDDRDVVLPPAILLRAGATAVTLRVPLIDDTLPEAAKTLAFAFGPVSGGATLPADQASRTVTLTDDDRAPVATLSADATTLPEGGGSVAVTLTLDQPSARETVAVLSLSHPQDVRLSTAEIRLPAFSQWASVTLTAQDDALVEGDEVVTVSLGSLTGLTAGSQAAVTVTVIDDDLAPAVTGVSAPAGTFGPGQTLSLSVDFSAPVTVTGGTPTVALILDGGTVTLTAAPTTGPVTALSFSRVLEDHDHAGGGIALGPLSPGGATIADGAGNAAVLSGVATTLAQTRVVGTAGDCQALRDQGNLRADGAAMVRLSGQPAGVVCDVDGDQAWTLVLKTNGDGTFGYLSSAWTDSSTLNGDDLTSDTSRNAKYAAFNTVPVGAMRGCLDGHCFTLGLDNSQSARALFAGGPRFVDGLPGLHPTWPAELSCRRLGLNVINNPVRGNEAWVRFGFSANENDCSDQETAIGFGVLNEFLAPAINAGAAVTCATACHLPDGSAVAPRMTAHPGTLWVRSVAAQNQVAPAIAAASAPAGSYQPGASLPVTVTFTSPVTLSGPVQAEIELAPGRTRRASLSQSSGTSAVFSYGVTSSDFGDGTVRFLGLVLNGGSVRDAGGLALNSSLPGTTALPGVVVRPVHFTSCQHILDIGAATADGTFTIRPASTSYPVWCDFEGTAGWTLVAKVGANALYPYESSFWTDTTLVNSSSADLSTTNAKLQSFIDLPVTEVRGCIDDGAVVGTSGGTNHGWVCFTRARSAPSLQSIFSGGGDWSAYTNLPDPDWRAEDACRQFGFNVRILPTDSNEAWTRFGFVANESGCSDSETAIGFGVSNRFSSPNFASAGVTCQVSGNSCRNNASTAFGYISVAAPGRLFVR